MVMTFIEWVAVGASIGIKAFFAVFTFGLCCMVILGFLSALAMCFGGDKQ